MAIDKLIPRYINNDDDFLVVKSVEMIDAINVHVGDNLGGNADVLKNSRGNTLMTFASGSELPATGTNTVVGSGLNIEKSEIVFAVHNSLGNHSIYHYSTASNVLRLVYRDSILGFTSISFVKFDFIVKENGDTLAYFTDGVTDPKKINITKALLGTGYPYKVAGGYTYTDEEKLLCITNAKQPPLDPPTLAFTNIANQENFIYDEYFQFAYQYVYEDGEVSALSPYSEIGVNTQQLLDGLISDSAKDLFNAINVTVKHSRSDVSKIRLLAKSAENLGFFAVDEINNVRTSTTSTILFTNNEIRSYIPSIEQNKMYDNVPQKANSQAISGSRLLYGGYTEFYDNVNTDVEITEINNEEGKSVYLSVNPTTSSTTYYSPATSVATSKFNFVAGDTINSTSNNSEVILDFQIYSRLIDILPGGSASIQLNATETTQRLIINEVKIDIAKQFTLPAYDDLLGGSPDVYARLISNISGNYNVVIYRAQALAQPSNIVHNLRGSAVINISLDAINYGTTQISFLVKIASMSLQTVEGYYYSGGSYIGPDKFTSFSLNPTLLNTSYSTKFSSFVAKKNYNSKQYYTPSNRSFKAGQEHRFGVVYYDKFNRSGAVNEIGTKEVSWYSDRSATGGGPVSFQFKLKHNPPSWASRWQLLYSPFTSYNYALQYSVGEAFCSSPSDKDNVIYVSMNTLEGKTYSYIEAKNAKLEYVFAEGDKLRIIKYETGTLPNGENNFVDYEFDILGYDYYDTTNTPAIAVPGTGEVISDDRKVGWFLKLTENLNATGFTKADIVTRVENSTTVYNADFWNKNTVVEIYRPIKQSEINIYREISKVFNVVNDSGTYRHKGDRDYSYTWTSGPSNITVSDGFAETTLDIKNEDRLVISTTILGVLTSYQVSVSSVTMSGTKKVFSVSNSNRVGNIGVEVPPNGNYSLASIDNLNDAVIETFNGDTYYRMRQMNVITDFKLLGDATSIVTTEYENMFVEDNSITDFADSKFTSVGRPNAPAPTAGRIYRKSTITYSEPYVLDSQILPLSSFNLGQANFVDLSPVYGSIQYIIDGGDSISILQERKCSVAPINRNIIEYISGGTGVTVSTNFIGSQSFYAGDYGVGRHPESVVNYFGRVYFADINTGKVIRLGPDGITPISEQGVDSYIQDKMNSAIKLGDQNFKFVGLLDPERSEYILSFQKRLGGGTYTNDTIAYDVKEGVWKTRYSFIPESGVYVDNLLITFKSGAAWAHTDESNRNNFYGVFQPSFVKVVSAQNNSMVKTFEALSVEGDSPWSFSVDTRDQSTVTISTMDKREGMYYSSIPTATTSTSNLVPLGIVTSVVAVGGGYEITLQTNINSLPFPLNGSIKVVAGGVFTNTDLVVSGISSKKTITVTGTTLITAGQTIAVSSDSSVDGDKMRGPYAVISFTNSSTSPIEAYAFNAVYNRSMLHNELVN
jgi:hypothetical protein